MAHRALWRLYAPNTDGLIYVVDSSDRERLAEAHSNLTSLISDEVWKDLPLLLLANKQDLPNSLSLSDVTQQMAMQSIKDRAWHVQGCSAITGEGVLEAMTEFAKIVNFFQQSKHLRAR